MIALDSVMPCPSGTGRDVCATCEARRLSVCSVLRDDGLRKLNAVSDPITFRAGEVLVREGDPATRLFNVTGGDVRVHKLMADGRRQIVGFLSAGDFLGLATGDRYAFSAEALTAGSACRFSKSDYRRLLGDMPDLEHALLDRAAHELKAAHEQILLLGRKTAMERLSSFLVQLADRSVRAGGDGRLLSLPMTRAEIADYLGLTTETVSRNTTRLKTRGVIRLVSTHSLRIEKPDELRKLAGLEAEMAGAA